VRGTSKTLRARKRYIRVTGTLVLPSVQTNVILPLSCTRLKKIHGKPENCLQQLKHLASRGCTSVRYSPVAVYPNKNNYLHGKPKIGLQQQGHLAFRGCIQKRYSPVAVYPTKKNINSNSRKIALRHQGHLAFRG